MSDTTEIAAPDLVSPYVAAAAARAASEADVRSLALAKIKARDAFNALLLASTKGMTDEQRIDREIELRRLDKEYDAAVIAFVRAAA